MAIGLRYVAAVISTAMLSPIVATAQPRQQQLAVYRAECLKQFQNLRGPGQAANVREHVRSCVMAKMQAAARTAGPTPATSIKDQLVGTWTLVSWEQAQKDGTKQQDFGANPKGIASFDRNGRFFVMFARPDLPKIASTDRTKETPQEAQAINVGSIAYFGTYTVDEPSKALVFKIEASTFPNQVGAQQQRIITSLTPDELKYTNMTVIGGGSPIETAFKRAK
jgi:Lipocalin-like domain